MQLMYEVYGIAGVMPREGMDVSTSLPAPTAALMAAITKAVFSHSLPWNTMFTGAGIIIAILFIQHYITGRYIRLSVLGIAIGMYLPLASSVPLFIGGVIAWFIRYRLQRHSFPQTEATHRFQQGVLIACGLVAGSALLDVVLAIPFSLLHSPDALRIVGIEWSALTVMLGLASTLLLAGWIHRRVMP